MDGIVDIIGHERVIERLWTAVSTDRLHHAYLFEGPKGLGKGTIAKRLSMAANCEASEGSVLPCGRCPTCVQISGGTHPDVWTVEVLKESASGTISVGQIRELVRKVGYHRFSAKRRVVIIDPAEAMTPMAANALLKTLEEPPLGTGFVLITHQSESLLPTIRSRCQRIRFGPVETDLLAEWLVPKGVADAERISVFSQGCPGQALALSEGEWAARLEIRDQFLNVCAGGTEQLFEWTSTLCSGNRQNWMPKVQRLFEVLEELLVDVVSLAAGTPQPLLHEDRLTELTGWRASLWPVGISRCGDAIEAARHDLARNVSGRLVLEALVSQFQATTKPL